jgi:putative membrane protein
MGGGTGMMGGMGIFWMALVWLVFLGLVAGGVWLVVRAVRGPSGQPHGSALQVFEERFARGEIDRDEFEERRRALQS